MSKISIKVTLTDDGGFLVSNDNYRVEATFYAESKKTLIKAISSCIAEVQTQERKIQLANEKKIKDETDFKAAERKAYLEGLASGKIKPRKALIEG